MWEKVLADMQRLGIKSESEYVRLMLSGEIICREDLSEALLKIKQEIVEELKK